MGALSTTHFTKMSDTVRVARRDQGRVAVRTSNQQYDYDLCVLFLDLTKRRPISSSGIQLMLLFGRAQSTAIVPAWTSGALRSTATSLLNLKSVGAVPTTSLAPRLNVKS